METEEGALPDVSYTPFKDLQPPCASMEQTIQELNNEDWREQFAGLDHLREFNKANDRTVIQQFPSLQGQIVNLANSLRSNVSKNALMFIQELFQKSCPELENSVSELIPLLAQKARSDLGFIKKQAASALENIAKNVPVTSLACLTELCFSRSKDQNQLAFTLLDKYVFPAVQIGPLLSSCAQILDCSNSLAITGAGKWLKKYKGSPEFAELINRANEATERKIQNAVKEKAKKAGFRDFMKHKKAASRGNPMSSDDEIFMPNQGKQPVRKYLETTVMKVLLQGLTQLAKTRPSRPLEWLGDYLIKNQIHK